jgi:hypothetical protein
LYNDIFIQVLHRLQTEPIKTIEVKAEAVAALNEHAREQLKITAWASHCSSWFKVRTLPSARFIPSLLWPWEDLSHSDALAMQNGDKNGNLATLHPGGRLHFFACLLRPRWEDFTVRRR